MPVSPEARSRLSGLWGGYENKLITQKHFLTPSDLVERFLDYYKPQWQNLYNEHDADLLANLSEVRSILLIWAEKKLGTAILTGSADTLHAHIMFKRILYGKDHEISFGSIGNNWKKKTQIAEELDHYRPWSMSHAIASIGGKEILYNHMKAIVNASNSPTEVTFFETWWNLSDDINRPMLFPQVSGHPSGKFFMKFGDHYKLIRFDFGLVNVQTRSKILIECDSRRYHSGDVAYQLDRDRQNVAERLGWSVRRFTYEDVMKRIDYCLGNITGDLYY